MFDLTEISGKTDGVMVRSMEIPFGNSTHQIDSIISEAKTPERAYRALLINYHKRFNDIKSCSIERRRQENKVKQLKRDMEAESDELRRESLALEIESIMASWEYENKLAADCIHELKYMQSMIDKMPRFNRAQFEHAEPRYFACSAPDPALPEVISSGKLNYLPE